MKHNSVLSPEIITLLKYVISKELNILYFENHHNQHLNLKKLVDLADHHRLYPILLKDSSVTDSISLTDTLQELRVLHNKNKFNMMKLSGELATLSKKLVEIDVQHLCLKGPVLAQKLYKDISLRTSKDLDILVPFNSVNKTEKLLIDQGYNSIENEGTFEELSKQSRHHKTYVHNQKNIIVELHWRLHPNVYTEPSFNQLWERREHVSIAGIEVPMLGHTDLFIFLTTHGARHAWFRLRWLLDIHKLLQHPLDFKQIQHISKELHVQHMVGQAIQLNYEFFEMEIPKELESFTMLPSSKILTNIAKVIISKDNITPFPFDGKYLLQKRYDLLLRGQRKKKREFIIGHFFPTQADKEMVNLPEKIEGLYFLLRPFLALVRRMRSSS